MKKVLETHNRETLKHPELGGIRKKLVAKEVTTYNPQDESVVVYRSADNAVQLNVRVSDETVWLTQQQMADLFGTQRQAITKHVKNIYECAELQPFATSSILEQVQKEGRREVTRQIAIYNLERKASSMRGRYMTHSS